MTTRMKLASAAAFVTLAIGGLAGAGLPLGQSRLIAPSNTNTNVHDLARLRRDGYANSTEGGDYYRPFTTVPPPGDLSIISHVHNPPPFDASTI